MMPAAGPIASGAARRDALSAFAAGDHRRAAALLRPLVQRDPDDIALLRSLGMALVRTGAAADGLPHLARAVRLGEHDPLTATWHGIALHAANRHAEAAATLQRASALAPADPAPLIHLSRALLKLERHREATEAADRAVSLAPRLPEAQHAARLAALVALQSAATASAPALAEAWLALGRACMRMDRVSDAHAAFAEALGLQPDHAEAGVERALSDHLRGQPVAAVARLRAILNREPDCLSARLGLASRLLLGDDAADALLVLDAEAPDEDHPLRPAWHLHRAQALVALRRDREAVPELERAASRASEELALPITWLRFVLARRSGQGDAGGLENEVLRLAATPRAGTLEQRIDAQFDLADLRHRDGQRRAAFAHWRRGHAMLRAAQPFSRDGHAAHLAAVTGHFNAARLRDGTRAAAIDPTPVFVVGLPRSGTTLLEQILDAHPMVHGAGERLAVRESLSRLTRAATTADAAARAAALDQAALDDEAARFLAELNALAPHAARIVDKMPDNIFHLGFIATLLPGARVICCTRDLRDVGASIFGHRFIGHHPYAHDLADLGWWIASQQRLLDHWRRCLPIPMLTLDHAEWLADFDATLRRVLAFLGLPFDAACARFFERDRRVSSASRAQVRQPINAAGVGRWKAYAEQLAPMLRELPP